MKKIYDRPLDNPKGISRRGFLSSCGACTACFATSAFTGLNALSSCQPKEKTRIRIIYSLHADKQAQPDWPNIGFDFNPVMDSINQVLTNKLGNFEFLSSMATGPEEAADIMSQDANASIDGYLVYQMNCWNQVVQTVSKSGKPVLYAEFQFGGSGGFLVYNSGFIRDINSNIGFV